MKTIAELSPEQCDDFVVMSWFVFSRQRRIWSFHVVVLQRTVKKCTKIYNARAQPLCCSLNLLFNDDTVNGILLPRTVQGALKALVNEDTLLPMMFLGLRKLGNICCGHKMFLNKIRNSFCVPDTKFVSATNVARAGKRGNICVGNNVSSFARALTPSCFFLLGGGGRVMGGGGRCESTA